jgi:uncharacterized membrane protein
MKKFVNYFVQGLLVTAPVALTLYVCYLVFSTIDGMVNLGIPGSGFVLTIALITLIGFLASTFLTRGLIAVTDKVMTKLPLVRLLYTSIKDLLNAFVGEKRRFDKPVLVQLVEDSDVRVCGFLTQESLSQLSLKDHVAVYVPQSYNFAGNLIVVPSRNVEHLEADSATVMAFIVSGGVTDPRALPRK